MLQEIAKQNERSDNLLSLNLSNDLFNNLKENKNVQNFIKELSSFLEKNEEKPIIEQIISSNNVSTGNENAIRFKEEETIIKYAKDNFNDETMYFVKDNKKTYWSNNQRKQDDNYYTVLKVENGTAQKMNISKNEMPNEISVNDVLKIENGKYVKDDIATTELKDAITDMANEILDKQNMNLDTYRKEGHLYIVTEEVGENRFLKDLTENNNKEFEEVNLPKDILEKAVEGTILKYSNGKYEVKENEQ
jgi:hypothetical protein